jgi:hypothetical protein
VQPGDSIHAAANGDASHRESIGNSKAISKSHTPVPSPHEGQSVTVQREA